MDYSIWDPSENQDESSYPTNSWKYNLYFDPRLDVIEEDALNAKSCKQVLKILTNEADSEIVELEDDIPMVQRQLTSEDYMDFAALNEKNVNLESMPRPLQNENQQPSEPGVGSSDLPEGLNRTVKFRDGCTVQASTTVLASVVEVENQQEIPAGTTLEDKHASDQEMNEYSSNSAQNEVKSVLSNDPSGMKGQEEMHNETDRTIEDTQPSFTASVVQENNDQINVQNVLVNSHGRTSEEPQSQEPQILSSVDNVDVASPESSSTPVPHVAPPPSSLSYIDNMSLVQLKALAHQHNIYGVSKTRKADLQQLLRSKLQI